AISILSDRRLDIELSIDPAGNRGPFNAGFTLVRLAEELKSLKGASLPLGVDAFTKTADELGGGFTCAGATIQSADPFKLHWPLQPFNQYSADNKSQPAAWQPRVIIELTPEGRRAQFSVEIHE